MNFKSLLRATIALTLSAAAAITCAQSGPVLTIVNGSKIHASQVNEIVSMAVANGATDSPQLRQNILSDLVVREAIAQDIKKTGLLSRDNNALKLKLAQQNTMLELWLADYFKSRPLTESDIRAEYDRQTSISKEPQNAKQYQVAQIMVATEIEAADIIKQISGGAKFEMIAKDKSLEKISAAQGGSVGWVLPSQLAPPINELIVHLGKGKINQTPVRTVNGWHVIKVDDMRPFAMPAFDQVRNMLAQELVQQRRQEAINSLLKDMKVVGGTQ